VYRFDYASAAVLRQDGRGVGGTQRLHRDSSTCSTTTVRASCRFRAHALAALTAGPQRDVRFSRRYQLRAGRNFVTRLRRFTGSGARTSTVTWRSAHRPRAQVRPWPLTGRGRTFWLVAVLDFALWRGSQAAYGTRLESGRLARVRGFESHPLRGSRPTTDFTCTCLSPPLDRPWRNELRRTYGSASGHEALRPVSPSGYYCVSCFSRGGHQQWSCRHRPRGTSPTTSIPAPLAASTAFTTSPYRTSSLPLTNSTLRGRSAKMPRS
jgi:hypothetical protein